MYQAESFYISLILVPLMSNNSEVMLSMYYASKKTCNSITVALLPLNSTLCLSIFFFLICLNVLAWQHSAETLSIVMGELIVGFVIQRSNMSSLTRVLVMSILSLSLVFVVTLEAIGLD